MKRIITILFLLTTVNAFAQGDTLTAKKAKSKINKEVVVKALVAGTKIVEKDGKSFKSGRFKGKKYYC